MGSVKIISLHNHFVAGVAAAVAAEASVVLLLLWLLVFSGSLSNILYNYAGIQASSVCGHTYLECTTVRVNAPF